MRISVSNIAWEKSDDFVFYEALAELGVNLIDVAPTKIWPDWEEKSETEDKFNTLMHQYEISSWGMQSIFYGTQGLNIFSEKSQWKSCVSHLERVAKIAQKLGVKRVVFGSPANRDPLGLTAAEAESIAVEKFSLISEIFSSHDSILCLEPVPEKYGGKFLTNTLDTASFVRLVNEPSLKLNLDSGVLCCESISVERVINECADVIAHVHASEPELAAFHNPKANHREIAQVLRDVNYDGVVAIEMRAELGKELINLETAIATVSNCYGD